MLENYSQEEKKWNRLPRHLADMIFWFIFSPIVEFHQKKNQHQLAYFGFIVYAIAKAN